MDALGDHALRVLVEERMHELQRFRRWYAAQPDPARWADFAAADAAELEALLRLWHGAKNATAKVRRDLADGDHFAGMPS